MNDTGAELMKATIYGDDAVASNIVPTSEDDQQLYAQTGAIPPPYPPEFLIQLFEHSSSLRPNIDVLTTNVEGFGHKLEPTIDLTAPDADDKIRDSLLIEALIDGTVPDLSTDKVTARHRELEVIERIERLRTAHFFNTCVIDMSFTDLRSITRMDLEITGNAYWEILRNSFGEISQIVYAPSLTMRLMRADVKLTETQVSQRVSDVSIRSVTQFRRFRRFVQVIRGQEVCYFKQYGDPRIISAKDGKIYQSRSTFKRAQPKSVEATEILHFRIHASGTAYGIPRWVGATLAVVGTRQSEKTNCDYFNHKAVPPLAILVSGGTLSEGSAEKITKYIQENIVGQANFHKILVLEAEAANGPGIGMQGSRTRIEIKNLMESIAQDALFQNYEGNNTEKVGAQFRIPRILRGAMTDFNRSTAESAIRYCEQQVFQPLRRSVDHTVNELLTDRGVRFLKFSSNGPLEKDPPVIIEMITKLVQVGIITPNEARVIAADALNARWDDIDAPWARIPVVYASAGYAPEPTLEEVEAEEQAGKVVRPDIKLAPTDAARVVTVNEARASLKLGPLTLLDGKPDPQGSMPMAEFVARNEGQAGIDAGPAPMEEQARRLVQLRDSLKEYEGQTATAALMAAREKDASVHTVPQDEWDSWFEPAAE